MKELRDKVAVVTGGSGGIGIEIGRAMLAKGMKVVLADLHQDQLDAVTKDLDSPDAIGLAVDVTDFDAVCALRDRTLDQFGEGASDIAAIRGLRRPLVAPFDNDALHVSFSPCATRLVRMTGMEMEQTT